ncbi:response regulator [Leptospira wolffii]|uniref:response regulator n=1 Tax=Leptospira wolffii TaxID=409998 RepID=UPI0002FD396A|nr:response regulator [Leptospira wolffii]EPG65012.1 response regulator receiver domain protein [Leptospira wolffii serovar Khorat str. Khorat-H2]TGK62227.1 response regulator [Leptospira wolffii]TGK66599.1 response regulator [Leptospira wolffii]TGK74389.1 response regulator [Leptospira wolffii]TGL32036.1 response regulator [Leptospira wolffii]
MIQSFIKVLFAEDNESSAELLIHFLERYNFEVDHVVDGMAAELKLRKIKYDFIILDNLMPVLSGIRLVNKIPDLNKNTPVVLLTASNEKEDVISAAHSKQLVGYILKPFDSDKLLQKIMSSLKLKPESLFDKKNFPFSIERVQRVSYGVGVKLNGCPFQKNAEKIAQEIAFILKELPEPRKFFIEVGEEFYYTKKANEILSSLLTRLASKYEIKEEDILVLSP